MPTIKDEEFGQITVRRNARASQIRITVAPNGTLRASMPIYAPMFLLKRLVKSSRQQLRHMIEKSQPNVIYQDGQNIGKSHTLVVRRGDKTDVKRHAQQIVVTLPINKSLSDPEVSVKIREAVISALRIEAKAYLPKRLNYLAQQYGFKYENVRFSHASSRWGSCSSNGTISLNIALMKLPFELIDYVILHELAHTVHMNHSSEFWKLVEQAEPRYLALRKIIKQETPSI